MNKFKHGFLSLCIFNDITHPPLKDGREKELSKNARVKSN